jgi:hypothetical protein
MFNVKWIVVILFFISWFNGELSIKKIKEEFVDLTGKTKDFLNISFKIDMKDKSKESDIRFPLSDNY